MLKKEKLWKALVYYRDGTSKTFFQTDKGSKIKTYTGYLGMSFTNRDAYEIALSQAGSNVKSLQVWPVEVTYNTKTKQIIEENSDNGNMAIDWQSGKSNAETGTLFESHVERRLKELFINVRRSVSLQGHSGEIWQNDFMVNDSLILEVSVDKRSEIKVNTTFLKFVDMARKHEDYKFALILESAYKKIYGKSGMEKREYISLLSPHRTFLAFGFPIVLFNDVEKLVPFYEGKLNACDCSSIPQGYIITKNERY